MTVDEPQRRDVGDGQEPAAHPPVRRISVGDLMGAAREAILVHDGQDYKLRITAKHKLILTK